MGDWWIYIAMPICMAIIGYVTKLLAIKMMFHPIEFVGWGKLGWQGIVPKHAARMASIASDLMLDRLISPRELIQRLDPNQLALELDGPIRETFGEVTEYMVREISPGLWERMPQAARARMIRRVQEDAPEVTRAVLQEIQDDIDQVLDLRTMLIDRLQTDKALLNRIFLEAGDKEFRFIARSGIVFGFLIGCVQALAWYLTKNPLLLPLFGIFTGWFTDWLALKMIFFPVKPRRFGVVTWQGLFLARRSEVSDGYSKLIATELITPHHLFQAMLNGPLSDRLFVVVQRHIQRSVDQHAGLARPLVVMAVGGTRYQNIKREIAARVMEQMPAAFAAAEEYTAEALDLANTLRHRMDNLSDTEFLQLIRPAFQSDEWKLILAGAVLGGVMGEAQVLVLEHLH